jgi:hypothetical protein
MSISVHVIIKIQMTVHTFRTCISVDCSAFILINKSRGGHDPLHASKPTTHTQNHLNKTNTVIHQ